MSNGRIEHAQEVARLQRARASWQKEPVDVLARVRAIREARARRAVRQSLAKASPKTRMPYQRYMGGTAGVALLAASIFEETTGRSLQAPWAGRTRGWVKAAPSGVVDAARAAGRRAAQALGFGGREPVPQWQKDLTPTPAPRAGAPEPTQTPTPQGTRRFEEIKQKARRVRRRARGG